MKIRENEGYFEVKLNSITEEDIVRAIDFAINDSVISDSDSVIPYENIEWNGRSKHLDLYLENLLFRIVFNEYENFFSFGVCYTEDEKDTIFLYDLLGDKYDIDEIEGYMIKQKNHLEEIALKLFDSMSDDLKSKVKSWKVEKPEHTFNKHSKDILVSSLMLYIQGVYFKKERDVSWMEDDLRDNVLLEIDDECKKPFDIKRVYNEKVGDERITKYEYRRQVRFKYEKHISLNLAIKYTLEYDEVDDVYCVDQASFIDEDDKYGEAEDILEHMFLKYYEGKIGNNGPYYAFIDSYILEQLTEIFEEDVKKTEYKSDFGY